MENSFTLGDRATESLFRGQFNGCRFSIRVIHNHNENKTSVVARGLGDEREIFNIDLEFLKAIVGLAEIEVNRLRIIDVKLTEGA